MAIELFLIRHGLAGESGSYANDDERPLTPEGMHKTQQVAERLHALGIRFDQVLTSPLVRARQTAEILCDAGLSQSLENSPHLAFDGSLQAWLPWFDQWRQTGAETLALVGHEPCLSEWTEQLVWGGTQHHVVFKKAGVVGLIVPQAGTPIGNSQIFWLTPPRFLIQ
ncbi:MAG: phosphohistidine phosphatase SixA [Cyanobacteria bacterium J069]|nr:MAG: phosphohistidine phosphatase SixA [Cyanobacteria bacterium J069]